MQMAINPDLIRDTHSLTEEATNVSQTLLLQAYKVQQSSKKGSEDVVRFEMSREGVILLSTMLHQLVRAVRAIPSS